jgi:hypothetical protein
MEDLQLAVKFMFGQATQEEHFWAVNLCNEFVENNFKNWSAFFDYIEQEANPELVKFFFLQALIDIVKDKFEKHFEKGERYLYLQRAF